MLYATTRSNQYIETAYKVIHLDCASDGGLFTPFRLPKFTEGDIYALKDRSFGQNMADILNLFFGCGLTGWDIEFSVGRSPVKMSMISHKIHIAEAWHSSQWKFDHVIQTISDRIRKEDLGAKPANWVQIAVRIGALFGIYGNLLASEQVSIHIPLDVAVTSGDFSTPMAAWYARHMGLPIGNIICGCNANGGLWELLHHGELSTGDIAVKTSTPESDIVIPRNLERLIFATLGVEETQRYLDCCHSGTVYEPALLDFENLRSGLFAAVISDSRVESMIHSLYRTSGYVLGPYAALAYGSLLDYRAKKSENRAALLLIERSPICDSEQVAKNMKVSVPELMKRINIT